MPKRTRKIELLEIINSSPAPVGAIFLSEKMGIPSATVGRMLAELEQENLLEKFSNRGRQITEKGKQYLNAMNSHSNKKLAADKLIIMVQEISKERLLEVLEVRKLLESKTAETAAQQANAEQVQMLDDILFDYFYEIRHGRIGSEEDLRFHLSIAKMANNATIYQILKLILQEQNAYARFSDAAMLNSMQVQKHTEILKAIKEKNPERAKDAMLDHLNQVIIDVQLYY